MTGDEFTEMVNAMAEDTPFVPTAIYSSAGDCIKFFAKPDAYYGVRMDDFVTVYRSQVNNEIVGCFLKGISRFLQECPQLMILFKDGKLRLEYLFVAQILTAKKDGIVREYEELIDMARLASAEAMMEPHENECCAA
ncbi:MAG TPA: hypothetical protein VKX17_13685 [Planctomycetota bacterium]|nr:hypothetical protein [Planctomycetota bacterium]